MVAIASLRIENPPRRKKMLFVSKAVSLDRVKERERENELPAVTQSSEVRCTGNGEPRAGVKC